MKRTQLGILLFLSVFCVCICNGTCAEDGPSSMIEENSDGGVKLSGSELGQFLGKWEGSLEQRKKRAIFARTVRMEVKRAETGGYRAIVFLGSIKPNVGMLHTSPPSEKEHKVKFRRIDDATCMKIKMANRDYVFIRKGETLYGESSSADDRPCILSRTK